ncbi:MAG TPA: hypothetical protein VLB84_02235 [Bacteroidia bacterium]|nr:hypothetical protein [Bacteroidia bacterium]
MEGTIRKNLNFEDIKKEVTMAHAKTIDHQILSYLEQLSEKKKKVILTVVKSFAEESVTLWDMMPDEVRKGVERGLDESKKGTGRSHEEVMKKYSKWLKK